MSSRKTTRRQTEKPAVVLFADAAVRRMDPNLTLPAKFKRLLGKLNLPARAKGKRVAIKMHFGGNIGYTTIPPIFVRILVEALKEAGAHSIKAIDNNPADGVARGYTREVLGCEVVSTFGASGKYLHRQSIGFKSLGEVSFGGEAVDCDLFIDLAHVKGHGACGFGGALKNIAMGVVPGKTRRALHNLEGGIVYNRAKCTLCSKCVAECKQGAITMNKTARAIEIFYHHCIYCQHCIMICPTGALTMPRRRFGDFAEGMARVATAFLQRFAPEQLLFINVLLNITMWCDCWGMSTPALVPDIGILASEDIVAVERASLDMIKTENLLPNGLPRGRSLMAGTHLFERVHGKDPYAMVQCLQKLHGGAATYTLKEIK
jgi:hypothetical protein